MAFIGHHTDCVQYLSMCGKRNAAGGMPALPFIVLKVYSETRFIVYKLRRVGELLAP